MRTLTYSDSPEFICALMGYALKGEDVEVPCPKCGKPLLIAVTREKASALGVHPGVFCTASRGHVYLLLSLTDREIPPGSSWVDQLRGK